MRICNCNFKAEKPKPRPIFLLFGHKRVLSLTKPCKQRMICLHDLLVVKLMVYSSESIKQLSNPRYRRRLSVCKIIFRARLWEDICDFIGLH